MPSCRAPTAFPDCKLLRNDGTHAFPIAVTMPGLYYGSAAWADYDGDGDLDVLRTGEDNGSNGAARLYRNDGGGVFTTVATPLRPVQYSSAQWGDYDSDGDLDVLLSGYNGVPTTQLVRNNGDGTFTEVPTSIVPFQMTSLAWGDTDNDGDPDIVIAGRSTVSTPPPDTKVYRNQGGGSFTDTGAEILGTSFGQLALGDYDRDGDLDLFITGTGDSTFISALYHNDAAVPNTSPTAPGGLGATAVPSGSNYRVTFSWNAGSDAETPAQALSYNLRVARHSGKNDVMPSMADENGLRYVAQLGNADQNRQWSLLLPPGIYFWSVQSIDAGYQGSAFAPEQSINVGNVGVEDGDALVAAGLSESRPNPFTNGTTVECDLPRESRVTLRVHDVTGRLVRTLADRRVWPAGRHHVVWNGRSESGRSVEPGVYFVTLDAEGAHSQRRVVRLR